MLLKKSGEKQNLINILIDQIDFLKNKLCSKDTAIKLITKNSKSNNDYFQNKSNTIVIKLKNS